MGNMVSSTLAMAAIRLSWICQKLLDPRYSCIESNLTSDNSANVVRGPPESSPKSQSATAKPQLQQHQQHTESLLTQAPIAHATTPPDALVLLTAKLNSPPTSNSKSSDNNNSLHQENRNRRAAQLRFRTRPSSFDAALIVRGRSKNSVIVASTPSPLRRARQHHHQQQQQQARVWDDASSSSGCSSDSGSASDSDSETELRVSENASNEEGSSTKLIGMSAEEEEAFRLTVGRGHFSRSKKDRFLNHLRLEKRLNDLNNEYLGVACKSYHRHTLPRRHSGDLHRII